MGGGGERAKEKGQEQFNKVKMLTNSQLVPVGPAGGAVREPELDPAKEQNQQSLPAAGTLEQPQEGPLDPSAGGDSEEPHLKSTSCHMNDTL